MEVKERAFGTKIVLYIDRVNRYRIKELCKEYEKDLPVTQPPDLATFATMKLNASSISK